MRKTKEQKNKLSRSVVLSIVLHVLLFGFIILGSLNQIIKLGGGGQSGEVVNAIMVDPGAVIEQYNQLQKQQNSVQQAIAERKKRLQQQEELRKQQEEEQKRLKTVVEERIKIEREAEQQSKQAEEAANEAKEQQKIAEEAAAKAKAEQERLIKQQAEAEVKARAEAQAKKEVEIAKAKAKAEKAAKALEAKKKADAAKQAAAFDDLLGGLTAQRPTQQTGGAAVASQGGNRKNGASSSDVANYAGKIKAAIESKFYDADIYRGKTCELSIKLAPDGILISITAKNSALNDQALCDAAIRAAKTATMPKPPSRSIYDAFNEQGSVLVFKP
ncbi:MAG TPA: cell envelope integrity protein TolA [Arsenophonus sp.]